MHDNVGGMLEVWLTGKRWKVKPAVVLEGKGWLAKKFFLNVLYLYLYTSIGKKSFIMFGTFLQLHREQVQPLHPFLQLVLSRRCHGVHVFIAPVVVFIGVRGKHLQEETEMLNQAEKHEPRVSLCTVFVGFPWNGGGFMRRSVVPISTSKRPLISVFHLVKS